MLFNNEICMRCGGDVYPTVRALQYSVHFPLRGHGKLFFPPSCYFEEGEYSEAGDGQQCTTDAM